MRSFLFPHSYTRERSCPCRWAGVGPHPAVPETHSQAWLPQQTQDKGKQAGTQPEALCQSCLPGGNPKRLWAGANDGGRGNYRSSSEVDRISFFSNCYAASSEPVRSSYRWNRYQDKDKEGVWKNSMQATPCFHAGMTTQTIVSM